MELLFIVPIQSGKVNRRFAWKTHKKTRAYRGSMHKNHKDASPQSAAAALLSGEIPIDLTIGCGIIYLRQYRTEKSAGTAAM
ncbi:hypothetical protein [Dysosmobacter sp.]